VRIRHDAPPVLRAVQRGHHGIGAAGHRAHEGPRLDALAPLEEGGLGGGAAEPRVESELHAALHEEALSELREVLGQLGQDEVARVEEDDPDLLGADVAEAPRRRAHKVVELGHRLHPGEAAARHHEGEEAAPRLRIPLDVGLLEGMDGVVPQHEGIAQILERQGMLAEPGLAGEARHVTEGDHELVVPELELARADTSGERDTASLQIDFLDGAGVEIRPRAQTTDGRDGVEDTDAPRHHLGQHGLEGQVVVPAHEGDLDLAALELALEELLERERRVHAAEAAAQDEDACGSGRVHG
jgi:hypothetical protein